MRLNDIIVRDLTDDDMLEVSNWYTDRKWRVPPSPGILPKTAYVSESGGELLAVIWLYVTNSGIGIVDWVATNPESGAKGLVSLKKIFKHVEEKVPSIDISTLIHFTHNDKLAKFINKKCGFKDDGKVNISLRVLKGGM